MFANLGRYVFLSYVTHTVWSQGPAQWTFSSNPVCSGEDVTLAFTYASGLMFVSMKVDAFDGAINKGFLFCKALPPNSTGVGGFAGKSLNGWPIPVTTTSLSLTLTATPLLELDYNASVTVLETDTNKVLTLTSTSARLLVHVPPSPPKFRLSPIIFNDSDSGVIICDSYNGKPATALSLTVSPSSGGPVGPANDISSTVMNLSKLGLPLSKWHKALATCRVTNNNCSNSSVPSSSVVSEFILINHITNTSFPDVIYLNESVVLHCSAYISFYRGVHYRWTPPPEFNVTGSLDLESFTVPQGQIGSFYCTATNNVTMTSVVIVFTVSNLSRPSTTDPPVPPPCGVGCIIGIVLGIIAIVVTAFVLGVLCKRGHFSKGIKSTSDAELHRPDVRAAERSNTSKLHSVDLEYESLDTQRSSESTYSQLVLEQNPNSATLYENLKSSKR